MKKKKKKKKKKKQQQQQQQQQQKQSKFDPFEPLWGGGRVVVERTSYPPAISICEREKERNTQLWYPL